MGIRKLIQSIVIASYSLQVNTRVVGNINLKMKVNLHYSRNYLSSSNIVKGKLA